MFRVQIQNGNELPFTIHDPQINNRKVSDGRITREVSSIDTFSFDIGVDNPGYVELKPFQTKISVFNMFSKRYEFVGRVLDYEESMDEGGSVIANFLCEGQAAYLHDSMQRHLVFRGSPLQLLTTIINYHNTMVETYKQFKIGTVNVLDSSNEYITLTPEKSSWDTIQETLINRLGGELQIRDEPDGIYIDYLKEVGGVSDVEIRLTKNLLTNQRRVDLTDIVSRLKPLGKRLDPTDEDDETEQPRLSIESVNGGKDYIDRSDLVSLVGIRGSTVVWDDVDTPANLIAKGREWLDSQRTWLIQYTITALDLALIDLEFESFRIGYHYRLINPLMGIDELIRIVGITISLDTPEASTLKLGDKVRTLADYQREMRDSGNDMRTLQDRVNNLNIPKYDIATPSEPGLMSPSDKETVNGIGNKESLTTTNKTNLVSAINELVSRITVLEEN